MQPGLCPIVLGGTIPIDPCSGDFFRTLIEERVRVRNSRDYSPETRARVALLFKLIANSGGYGIFAELNREDLPVDELADITVFGHGEPYECTTSTPEEMGAFCFPPVAALISAAARLMLALLEKCVTERGGTYAFCDTDSMAIVATQFGGLVECEGGTADETDRIEAIRALTWQDVESIRANFDTLNPYDSGVIPSILNIEDVNFKDGAQREIVAHVISAKRYALFSTDETGAIHLQKCSEHGLGQLMSPIPKDCDDKWPEILWALILAEEHEVPHALPEWLKYPAVARVRIERANKWLSWEKDQYIPHGDVLTAINATYANGGKTDAKAKANAKVEMAHYTKLCQIKHGNPKEREQFGIDMDEVGRPARFAVDELSPAFIDASRMALWYAIRYLWLGTCCYNDFHAAEAHHDVRAAQLTDLRMTIESTRQADEMRMLTRI
ncbi:MAG TPA: hypothetical protein VII30_05810 [Gemmatimonadaceae bacterium]